MSIVDDYAAIAKRLRELQAPKSADEITGLERWRSFAYDTARRYVDIRRRQMAGVRLLPRSTNSFQ